MKILIQCVNNANVKFDNKLVSEISRGYLLFTGFTTSDTVDIISKMVAKISKLRLFADDSGKTNLSLKDINGEILSVSQFTLYASLTKGNRPSFVDALEPMKAKKYYDLFNEELIKLGFKVKTGIFGADMKVSLVNDGPFTVMLDSEELFK